MKTRRAPFRDCKDARAYDPTYYGRTWFDDYPRPLPPPPPPPPPLPTRPHLARSIRRGYREGEQVYISYGQKSNDELLQFYGFVEADCPADTFVVVSLPHLRLLRYLLLLGCVAVLAPSFLGADCSSVMLSGTKGCLCLLQGVSPLHWNETPGTSRKSWFFALTYWLHCFRCGVVRTVFRPSPSSRAAVRPQIFLLLQTQSFCLAPTRTFSSPPTAAPTTRARIPLLRYFRTLCVCTLDTIIILLFHARSFINVTRFSPP